MGISSFWSLFGVAFLTFSAPPVANAVSLFVEFEATVTRVNDNDAPFDDIVAGDVVRGYFQYDTEAFTFIAPDGRGGPGPTNYFESQVPDHPLSFVRASMQVRGHTFESYALGGGSVGLWDEPATPAGFDQFSVSTVSQAAIDTGFSELMAATLLIQLIDALVDEGPVQEFSWSAALEPGRAFERPFGVEFIQPNPGAVSGRSRVDLVGDVTYVRASQVPLPPAAWLLGTGVAAALAQARRRAGAVRDQRRRAAVE